MSLSRDLQLLAEPIRVRLLTLLTLDELTVGELVQISQLPQSTVSRHLKQLRDAGWVSRRAAGTASWFQIAQPVPTPDLWAIVRADSPPTDEERERLAAVVTARRVDSRTFFGRMHGRWDALRTELFGDSFILPALLALLPPGRDIAELGCGTGPNLVALAPTSRRVVGIDREQTMLDAAADRVAGLDNVELLVGDLDALPLADGSMDLVLCVLVLHHIPDIHGAFAEMGRVLRPGGRVALTDMRAHDRASFRDSMGHAHLGFARDDLETALPEGMALERYTPLTPDPDMQGPPLFTAVLHHR